MTKTKEPDILVLHLVESLAIIGGLETVLSTIVLNLDKKNYLGTAPKPASKPFNIDIVFHENDKKYLAAFDGLDE